MIFLNHICTKIISILKILLTKLPVLLLEMDQSLRQEFDRMSWAIQNSTS